MTLRDLRTSRDLTLRDVEAATGIFYGHLSEIERGVRLPSPAQMVALAAFYEVELAEWRLVPTLDLEPTS